MKLTSAYNPSEHESHIYKLWENNSAFKPVKKGNGYFSLVAPPPNANGNLHIGYGLTMAIEDTLARYNRLRGRATLFVPGADHAGFETWVVYERKLEKEGKSRFDYSREELYRQVWDFVAANRLNFEKQFRRLGASTDWGHFTFTLDDKVVKQAYRTFKKMWDEGLIYRGERLVNFCTYHGTSFADVEVEYKETEGSLWYLKYPLTDGSGEIIVATTRPETMLGDTAVAVHPSDQRYAKLVGKNVTLPLSGREVPVVADAMVDKEFGSGAVKITPAHDPNDFELGERHHLPRISVIDYEGFLSSEVPSKYRGLSVKEARRAVVTDLKKQGALQKIEEYTHSVGHCYKCGTVIEPLLREQWFIDTKPLAKQATAALSQNKVEFYPASKKDQLVSYFKELRDWNISRQIAWGIPIPAFQNVDNPDEWIFDERVDQEIIEVGGKKYRRDPDVFDTWFSSSSWPYVTLDYPSEDFKQFYPLSVMETGGEILYPWVSRMIMLGLYATGKVPFEKVYIHGYVMAEGGAKMSKSLGNIIDLTEVIDKYGSDALRMGLIAGRVPGVNRGYDSRRVEEARNFCNKLWNVARFIQSLEEDTGGKGKPHSPADDWILNKLSKTIASVSADLENFRLNEAYEELYHFVWDDLADWYVEALKVEPAPAVARQVLESTLKITHPFAPFVSETIWQTLGWQKSLLITSDWPKLPAADSNQAAAFEKLVKLVTEIRQVKSVLKLKQPALAMPKLPAWLEGQVDTLKQLARLGQIKQEPSPRGLRLASLSSEARLEVKTAQAKKYQIKLTQEVEQAKSAVELLKKRLANKNYALKAPAELVRDSKTQLAQSEARLKRLKAESVSWADIT